MAVGPAVSHAFRSAVGKSQLSSVLSPAVEVLQSGHQIHAVHASLCRAGLQFGNENEARAFAKSEGWETDDVEDIALRVRPPWKLEIRESRFGEVHCEGSLFCRNRQVFLGNGAV